MVWCRDLPSSREWGLDTPVSESREPRGHSARFPPCMPQLTDQKGGPHDGLGIARSEN